MAPARGMQIVDTLPLVCRCGGCVGRRAEGVAQLTQVFNQLMLELDAWRCGTAPHPLCATTDDANQGGKGKKSKGKGDTAADTAGLWQWVGFLPDQWCVSQVLPPRQCWTCRLCST